MIKPIVATIQKISTLSDKSLRIVLDTQEADAEMTTSIFQMHQKIGHFLFIEGEPDGEEIKDLPDIQKPKDKKSQSQRLREIIYLYWSQRTNGSIPFERYYAEYMEKIINRIKEKL